MTDSWLTRDLPSTSWRWACTLLLASTAVGSYVLQLTSSQFYSDDFLYLRLAHDGPIDAEWFLKDNYGHFAPLTRLAYLAVEELVGLDYVSAALWPALLVTVIVAGFLLITRQLTGPTPLSLLLSMSSVVTVFVMRTMLWFGSAQHVLGAAAAYVLACAFFIVRCRTGSRVAHALSVAAMGCALLVQERPLVAFGYLVLIRYLMRCGLAERAKVRSAVVRDLGLWAPYAAVLVLYSVYRFALFSSTPQPGSTRDGLTFIASGVMRSFLPGLAGAQTGATSGWLPGAAALGGVVLVLLFAGLAAVREQWWRAATFFVLGYVANMAMLAAGRLGVSGAVHQSRDLQYFVDGYLVLPLAFALGLGCLPARRRESTTATERRTRIVLGAAGVLVVVSTTSSIRALERSSVQSAAHQYLERSQQALASTPGPYDLLRLNVPVTVAPAFIAPYNDLPGIFEMRHGVRDDIDPGAPNKLAIAADGSVVTASPVTLLQLDAVQQQTVVGNGAVLGSVDDEACITGPAGSYLDITLAPPVAAPDLFFGLAYSSDVPEVLRAATVDGGAIVYNWNQTSVEAGSGESRFDRLEGEAADRLLLLFEDGVTDFCVTGIWIGQVGNDQGPDGCQVLDHDGGELGARGDVRRAMAVRGARLTDATVLSWHRHHR